MTLGAETISLINAKVASLVSAAATVARVVSSDFFFVPALSDDEKVNESLGLLISKIAMPIYGECCADIEVEAASGGLGQAIVMAMAKAGSFSAAIYEGAPEFHLAMHHVQCTFSHVMPVTRAWEERSVLLAYRVTLGIRLVRSEWTEGCKFPTPGVKEFVALALA